MSQLEKVRKADDSLVAGIEMMAPSGAYKTADAKKSADGNMVLGSDSKDTAA